MTAASPADRARGVVASYARSLATERRDPGDLGRNATLWIASRLGLEILPRALRGGLAGGDPVDEARFVEAPYLAALGYLVDLGLAPRHPLLAPHLGAVLARTPFTREACGFADDPVRFLGLALLAKATDPDALERLGAVYAEAAREPSTSPTRALMLGLVAAELGAPAPPPVSPSRSGTSLDLAVAATLADGLTHAGRGAWITVSDGDAGAQLVARADTAAGSLGRAFHDMLFVAALERWCRIVGEGRPSRVASRSAVRDSEAEPVDLGIVIALKEEFRVFRQLLGGDAMTTHRDPDLGDYVYKTELHGHRCVIALMGEMGGEAAVLRTDRLVERWHPRLLVNLGIAGSIHDDLCVGDAVVASQIDSYMEAGRAEAAEGTAEGFRFVHGGTVFHADFKLVELLRQFEFAHVPAFNRWRERCAANLTETLDGAVLPGLLASGIVRPAPELHDCHLASGPAVSAAADFAKWIRGRDRNLKAIEMESGGVARAGSQRANPIPVLALRGISDGASHDKAAQDGVGKGALRRYAMHNILVLFAILLEERALLAG